jgi:uncharacterized OsmC-like protein
MSEQPDPRTDPATLRGIDLTRLATGRYEVVNRRGGRLDVGTGDSGDFTPVELLLAAIAGCSAIDVGLITAKRAEPEKLDVRVEGHKIRDDQGNHLVDLRVTFDVAFPEGPDGDRAREALPRAVEQTRDRLCTVSRTVALGEPVHYVVADGGGVTRPHSS